MPLILCIAYKIMNMAEARDEQQADVINYPEFTHCKLPQKVGKYVCRVASIHYMNSFRKSRTHRTM